MKIVILLGSSHVWDVVITQAAWVNDHVIFKHIDNWHLSADSGLHGSAVAVSSCWLIAHTVNNAVKRALLFVFFLFPFKHQFLAQKKVLIMNVWSVKNCFSDPNFALYIVPYVVKINLSLFQKVHMVNVWNFALASLLM